ncbi:TetR/AcrR family transcriptional regulator [Spirillospora sp. CA-294931]|uniref:TetR/AcrR family transcriptional regulator n=1 Tax=Spirillospora sp. CA-294931 TaxID=3240042 RepID=UPI003D921FD9
MPRVSEEHLERRRHQILDAARACFIRRSIHETSMQDIFTESGLSAGAVYRYFKSKNEIIEAIIATVVDELYAFLSDLVYTDPVPPLDSLIEAIVERIVVLAGPEGPARLAPQAWALAMYDSELGHYVQENFEHVRALLIAYVGRLVEAGRLPADTDTVAAGKAVFGMMPGCLLQYVLLGDLTPAEITRGMRAIGRETMLTVHSAT